MSCSCGGNCVCSSNKIKKEFKVGQIWVAGNQNKYKILSLSGYGSYPLIGQDEGTQELVKWSANGKFSHNCSTQFDLVKEYKEPIKREATIYLYQTDITGENILVTTLKCSHHKLLAKKRIVLTEGDGI